VVGGTSLGATAWSGIMTLADQGRSSSLTDGHDDIYQMVAGVTYATDFRNITSGNN
jgi:hypothetical protein